MSTISSLEFWADPGYMEGSVVVPKTQTSGLTTTAPNYLNFPIDAKGINVPTGEMFSSMTLKGTYSELLPKAYLRVTFEMNNSDDLTFYGWIDSVNLKSDTEDNPVTIINWHVDLWRTYYISATYGYGLVTSRPASDTDPPQSLSYRYRSSGDYRSMIPSVTGSDLKWLVFTYVKEVQNATGTRIRTCAIPLNTVTPSTTYTLYPNPNASDAENCNTDSLTNVASGLFLQNYGISATQISSAFISPVPPFEIDHIDGNKIYAKSETTGSTTEILTSTFDTARIKRVISMNLSKTSSGVRLNVSYSDGTGDTRNFLDSASLESDLKNFLDSQCGSASGGYLTAPSESFRSTVRDIMNTCFPETDWKNGDTVVLRHVAESRSTSITRKSYINPEFEYNISYGDFQDRSYAYNNGWPTTPIYSDIPIPSGQYTYRKDNLVYSVGVERSSAAYGYFYSKSQYFASYEIDLGGIKTTDTSELVVLDMTGHPVASSPWGIELGKGTVRPVISAVSAYLQYRFHDYYSATDGVEFTIPMEPVTICSNSYDDYVYSGQRDYDISQKRIASQQALVGGITSAITGSSSNYIMGQIGKERRSSYGEPDYSGMSLTFPKGASPYTMEMMRDAWEQAVSQMSRHTTATTVPMGALKTIGATLGTGIGASLLEFGVSQHFNSELQKAEDMLQAKQFDNITVSGSGWDWLWYGKDIGIVTLVADDYSLNRFNTDKRLNGIYCSEPTDNCNTLISVGGPLQIIDLEVFGNIPVEARAYIKGRFANGVRILDR